MIELRVQTVPKSSPEIVLRHAIANLRAETKSMLDQFDEGVAKFQAEAEKNKPDEIGALGMPAAPMDVEMSPGPGTSDSDARARDGPGYSSGGERLWHSDDENAADREAQFNRNLDELIASDTDFSPGHP